MLFRPQYDADGAIEREKADALRHRPFYNLAVFQFRNWKNKWRGPDLNRRPRGYEPRELPGCSTPRYGVNQPNFEGLTYDYGYFGTLETPNEESTSTNEAMRPTISAKIV